MYLNQMYCVPVSLLGQHTEKWCCGIIICCQCSYNSCLLVYGSWIWRHACASPGAQLKTVIIFKWVFSACTLLKTCCNAQVLCVWNALYDRLPNSCLLVMLLLQMHLSCMKFFYGYRYDCVLYNRVCGCSIQLYLACPFIPMQVLCFT